MSDVVATDMERCYNLLIVDDDETDRRAYGRLLARKAPGGFRIVHAATGDTGLALLQQARPDCVLLDFSLPDMDGFEFLTEAAPDGILPCAVVLVTGQGNEAIAVEMMKRGVQDYLVKDRVNENSLCRSIIQAVTQNELRQRLALSLRDLTAANVALERQIAIREAAEIELRTAKEAAEQASAAKTRFVAMVTHELRTPLNGVLGYAQLLRVEGGLSPKQETRVTGMIQAGQHLLGMIEQVLDFADLESGRITVHPVPVAIRALGKNCLALLDAVAQERGLRLRLVQGRATPKRIVADPARLRQVMLNLLGNAVKYTQTGTVELRLIPGASPGGLRVEVVDTGPGIAPEHLPRLFQDFERLGAASAVEGAGLGLAIAARIVGALGGRIGHAHNPGGGSVFWLDVPTAETEADTAQPQARAAPPLPSRRVLLVDDIAMNRDVISAVLAAAGHQVVQAADGLHAIRLAATESFDLILMDVRMAGIDGLDATRRIRALPAPRGHVPILALTAHAFPEQIAQCRAAGMDGHVSKPVDYRTLPRAMAEAIARGAARVAVAPAPDAPPAPSPPPQPPASTPLRPRLDRAQLDQTIAFLPQQDVTESLQALRARNAAMQRLLDLPSTPLVVAEAAHQLGALAGMFGFAALSTISCDYERAASCGTPETAGLVQALRQQLREENCAALALLDAVVHERRLLPR